MERQNSLIQNLGWIPAPKVEEQILPCLSLQDLQKIAEESSAELGKAQAVLQPSILNYHLGTKGKCLQTAFF